MIGSVRLWLREQKEYSLYVFRRKVSSAVDLLKRFIRQVQAVCVIGVLIFFVYSNVSVQLFKESFYRCVGEDLTNIRNMKDCLEAGYQWVNRDYNFDSMPQAMITMLVILTSDKEMEIVHNAADAVGIEQQPVENYNPWVIPFFISFMMLNWFLMHIFIIATVLSFQDWRMQRRVQPRHVRRHLAGAAGG